MFEKPTPIQINSLGFRGKDFNPEKQFGVYRVVCMGESSTFGFFDRDDFIYPAILEREMNKGFGNQNVEVINAGIPHADSDNLLAMLKGELISYRPDLITIYAGFNNAGQVMDATLLERALRWIHGHIATYVALKRFVSALGGPELYSRYAKYGAGAANQDAYVKRQIELHVDRYDRNIREVIALAETNKIHVVLIKQALDIIKNQKKKHLITASYDEEVAQVEQRLKRGGVMSYPEVILLVYSALMKRIDLIAQEKHLPIVDNISIADMHPKYFASYVHLTEDGNQALAEAMSATIAGVIRKWVAAGFKDTELGV